MSSQKVVLANSVTGSIVTNLQLLDANLMSRVAAMNGWTYQTDRLDYIPAHKVYPVGTYDFW
jgi:hypothetical protein